MSSGKANDEELWKYQAAMREARWLLDASVAEYLQKELYGRAVDLAQYDAELDGEPVGPERTRLVGNRRDAREWLRAQYEVIDAKFAPYLQLKH